MSLLFDAMSLRPSSRELIEAQEQERARLARELHDDLGQRVALLSLNLAHLGDTVSGSSDVHAMTRAIQNQVLDLGDAIQRLSHRLHSFKLDYLGLAIASAQLCAEMTAQHGL